MVGCEAGRGLEIPPGLRRETPEASTKYRKLGREYGPQLVRSQSCNLIFTPLPERLKRNPFEVASSLITTPFSFLM